MPKNTVSKRSSPKRTKRTFVRKNTKKNRVNLRSKGNNTKKRSSKKIIKYTKKGGANELNVDEEEDQNLEEEIQAEANIQDQKQRK